MKLIKLFACVLLLFSCNSTQTVESKITEFLSDKLHDPNSFEIVEIKNTKKIYSINLVENNLKWAFEHLKSNNKLLVNSPNEKFYKTNVEKYKTEIENYQAKIDSMKNGSLENNIEHFEVSFSYRAKNKLGALVLSNAIAKVTNNIYTENKNNYGKIISVDKIE